jgi:wyosine [tRNA(Phe)-imidazoG37] synthetase (radical SAM superfamily)
VAEPISIVPGDLAAVKDHSRQYGKFTYVYPALSRRSRGLSIGVNLNPDKICNFDCIYCEVNRRIPALTTTVDLPRIRQELLDMIEFVHTRGLARQPLYGEAASLVQDIKDIAFSGDGEPTMVHNFEECVQTVADVKREAGLAGTKIVLITNAAGLDKAGVQAGLRIMEANNGEIWGKLDAGTEAYYRQVNRTAIRFQRILDNLLATARLRPIIIQSLFLKVRGEVMSETELLAYCSRLNDLVRGGAQLREVHAYTVARPTPEEWATRLEPQDLDRIARTIRQETNLPVFQFS